MKIAAVLFILSVYYIANTEQAAYPRSWEEMEREVQQGIKNIKDFTQGAKAQADEVPTDPEKLYKCANKDCPEGEDS